MSAKTSALSVEKITGRDRKWPGELLHHRYRGIAPSTLNVADIGPVNPSAIGIILLTPALRFAKAAYIKTKARLYIHIDLKDGLSPINLQTISDICLDFAC